MEKARRESKKEFWARVQCEGRYDEVTAVEAELLAEGACKRGVQAALVRRFQPMDGSSTVACATPNPWDNGRVDWKKPGPDPQELYDLGCEWAYLNSDRELGEAPTEGAKLALQMRKERPLEFLKMYEKCATRLAARRQRELETHREKVRNKRLEARRQERERHEAARRREEQQQEAARRKKQELAREARRKEWREKKAAWREGVRNQQAEAERQAQERQRQWELAKQADERRKHEQQRQRELERAQQEKKRMAEQQRNEEEAKVHELARSLQIAPVSGASEEL